MTKHVMEQLASLPNCAKLWDEIHNDFSQFFEVYGISVISAQEGGMYQACSLVVSTGAMNILFLRERGPSYEMMIGPSSAVISSSTNWFPVSWVLDFIEGQFPVYGGPNFIDKRVTLPGGLLESLENVHRFFTHEYDPRHEEFLNWQSNARQILRASIEEYDARRRQNQESRLAIRFT